MSYLHVARGWHLLAMMVFITLTAIVTSCAPAPPPTPPVPAGPLITDVEVQGYLPADVVIKGVSDELPSGSSIWVALSAGGKYYLLDRAVTFERLGQPGLSWQVASPLNRLGYPMLGPGESATVISLVADSSSTEDFEALVAKSLGQPVLLGEVYVRNLAYDEHDIFLPR